MADPPVEAPYVEAHETHSGVVFLVGDRAYKTKKPIVTEFLDFSTVERREAVCAREVQLNRRLAPSSYLGVAHLSDPQGGAAEPVIVMRRHPESCRLSGMASRGEPVCGVLDDIADVLARFHRQAERGPAVDERAGATAVAGRWRANLAELADLAGGAIDSEQIDRADLLSSQYVSGRAALFTQRVEEGRIVDGHGDLLTGDIFCLPDGPALLDCLEFDDKLRYVDGIDDAAFLAMDLEYLGRDDLARHFMDAYRRCAADDPPQSLQHLYIGYRASVRAKVDALRYVQGHPDGLVDAQRHLSLALNHLATGAVRLGLVGGAPGTGKSTLARALAERVDAVVISSDEVRRELERENVISGSIGELDAGLYSAENVSVVYDTIARRAEEQLRLGRSVILDATWNNPELRQLAYRLAERAYAKTVELVCGLPVADASQRVQTRPRGASDATADIAVALGGRFDEWPEAHPIDTGRSIDDCVTLAEQVWRLAV